MPAILPPLPSEPTPGMRAAFDVLMGEHEYPIPTGQAALWAALSSYTADPVTWVTQLATVTRALIEDEG